MVVFLLEGFNAGSLFCSCKDSALLPMSTEDDELTAEVVAEVLLEA